MLLHYNTRSVANLLIVITDTRNKACIQTLLYSNLQAHLQAHLYCRKFRVIWGNLTRKINYQCV